MKKLATGLTLSAAMGLSLLATAPGAAALDRNGNYQNCAEVYADGISHIGPEHPKYDKGLDNNDDDLIGCENPEGAGYTNTVRWAPSAPSSSNDLPDHVTLPDAVDNQFTYPDCKDVFAAGLANLPKDSEYYHEDLDADLDGVGCEANGDDAEVPAAIVAKYAAPAEDAAPTAAPAAEEKQVTEVPTGAVDAGVAPEGDPAAALTVGALGLAAMAGVAVRRRVRA